MALPMPIPPKPPWYSTSTAIASLPTAVPNCNSLIESPTDTPATENRKNTSYDNINNADDDNNNNDADCFHRQDKQPVLPSQDISPTAPTANNTPPSLIEPPTDTRENKSYDNIENNNDRPDDDDDDDDDDDVDCFPRQDKQPVLPQDILPIAPTPPTTLPLV